MSDLLAFQAFPKIDRYTNESFTITEKIDGTNACISFDLGGDGESLFMTCQSRNRIIVPGDDNAGFAKWAHENERELFEILGPGRHYGEWWGAGIQRRYGLDHKVFSLFNTYRWDVLGDEGDWVGSARLACVPVLAIGPLDLLSVELGYTHHRLSAEGSKAAPGFMDPEGCMIYLHRLGRYLKAPLDATPKWVAEATAA